VKGGRGGGREEREVRDTNADVAEEEMKDYKEGGREGGKEGRMEELTLVVDSPEGVAISETSLGNDVAHKLGVGAGLDVATMILKKEGGREGGREGVRVL